MQDQSKYHFRRRDYTKIRNWYEFSTKNYIPSDPSLAEIDKQQKQKEWHFRISFKELFLTQMYVNSNLKRMLQLAKLVFLSSLYNQKQERILSYGKEIPVQCDFDVTDLKLVLKEELVLFFFLETNAIKNYQLCFEIQMIDSQGELYKLGASRFPLFQRKDAEREKILLIFNNLFEDKKQQEELQTLSTVHHRKKDNKDNKDNLIPEQKMVGRIEFELDTQELKQMKRYLPPFRIIDKNQKIPPTSFNLKKKKEQITVEPNYQVVLQDLLFKIEHPSVFRQQVINNNPFTLSHKDYVDFEVKEYRTVVDSHNGWKFLRQNKNQLKLELVVENQEEIYISSKKIHNTPLSYYESDLMVMVIILICKVEFILKGVTQQKRTAQFIVGWLPLPLDLSQKENKIQLMMVNDLEFPTEIPSLYGVPSIITTTIIHNLHHKYKSKQEENKIFTDKLLVGRGNISESTKYLKLKSIKQITDTLSSESELRSHQAIESQFRAFKEIIRENEEKSSIQRCVKINGRPELGELHHENQSMLPMQSTVGKFIKVKIDIDSLIPQTNCPSSYYLPRKMKANLYFLRQSQTMSVNIQDNQGSFHVPLRLNPQKSSFFFTLFINSVEEFQSVMSSRFIITFYEEDDDKLYAKGITSAHDILGAVEADQYAYVNLFKWNNSTNKIFGTLLVKVSLQVQKKQIRSTIDEINMNKVIQNLPPEQRMKMRIGCFKGDEEMKNQAVSYLKRKQHHKFVQNVVLQELQCDGQLQYQIGKDVYHLLGFMNENKSQVNDFTFHLSCPYAQIITSQQEYRQIVSEMNVEQLGYQNIVFNLQDPVYLSFYETKLRFNQEIGILVKLNVNQYIDTKEPLSRLELIIKRNTIQAKRYILKCKYKEPLIYDVFYDYGLLDKQQENRIFQTKTELSQEILQNYKDIQILNRNIVFNHKSKEVVISKTAKFISILILAHPIGRKDKVILMYQLSMLPGIALTLSAGEPRKVSIELQNAAPVQVLKCHQSEVSIINVVKFYQGEFNQQKDLIIQPLRPYSMKKFIIGAYDLAGVKLGGYLIKMQSILQSAVAQLQLIFDQQSTYSISFDNPYPCPCKFALLSSSKSLFFEQKEIKMEGYGSRVVLFDLLAWDDKQIFVYLLDSRANVCQVIELICKIPHIEIEDAEED